MKYFLVLSVFILTAFLAINAGKDSVQTISLIEEFIMSLDDEQRKKAVLDFDSSKRKDWHFLPEKSYPRSGLRMDNMSDLQKENVKSILRAALSELGYQKTMSIIDLELILAELESNPSYRDPELYSIAFFGNPMKDGIWSWSFGGHHLALSFTYVDGELSLSPRFFGANPAVVLSGKRKGLAVLDAEEQGGLKLINSMSKKQKEAAIISKAAYTNILTENKEKVEPFDSSGITVHEMTKSQKEDLRALINVYLSSIPKDLANKRMEQIDKEDFDEILFAWAGASEQFKAHYYRIQGKSFLIEFDNAQNNSNHIHTVWRDFDGDFGEDLIRKHREMHDH